MKTARFMKAVCAVGVVAACSWGLAGCSSSEPATVTEDSVAATVNGTPIPEAQVTDYIEGLRQQYNLVEESEWGTYLAQMQMTPESLRENIINQYAQMEVIQQGAEEAGITVDSAEVDSYVDAMKSNYGDDEQWQQALEGAGITEDQYREEIESQLKGQRFMETFETDEEPSNDELLQYGQMYAQSYDGAKRSSHILFDSSDAATAQEVLDKINSGELDFAEAAQQYSKDSSATNGGDVGWDKMTSFVEPYQTALDGLEVGQVSGLVTSDYGIHIIKCTDEFVAPKTTDEDGNEVATIESIDQLPEEWVEQISTQLKSQKQNEAYQEWVTQAVEEAEIVINPMPEGLPYDVDMSQYESEVEQEAIDENAGVSSTPEDEQVTDVETENVDVPEDASADQDAATNEGEGTAEGSTNDDTSTESTTN
ncbi:SurA N-terminal domain-containing protein [Eggerthellaceae bacterium 3-80]|nr:peptidylprolyl isomerase [bacterium D16-34]